MKITIKNIIKENKDIDPKQRYINGIIKIIKPPYLNFLKVNEVPEELWNEILTKVFNQEVIISNNVIYDLNDNEIYYEDYDGFWSKKEYDENNNIIYFENSDGFWKKYEYDSNNNKIYYEDSNGFWSKSEYDSNNNEIYYEDSTGTIIDKRPSNPINENTDPKQRYINGILNMIRRPYMGFLIDNEVPEELWKDILTKIFNTNDISWEMNPDIDFDPDIQVRYELIIQDEKGRQLYYEVPDYWEQLIYGYSDRLDMDFNWFISSGGLKRVNFIGKNKLLTYSNQPHYLSWTDLPDDIKNNKFFDLNY